VQAAVVKRRAATSGEANFNDFSIGISSDPMFLTAVRRPSTVANARSSKERGATV